MPQARKQRDEHHAREVHEGGARFVHYTSAESALSIIKSKHLWMRNTTCMTDFREVQHGFDILARFFFDEQKKGHSKRLWMCALRVLPMRPSRYLISGGKQFASTLTLRPSQSISITRTFMGGYLCGVLSETALLPALLL
jgi:hypothetical protein